MTACPITGDAVLSRTIVEGADRLQWDHADPEIHITVELLGTLDEVARTFLEARYEVAEPCPHDRGLRHARRREVTRP